MSKQKKIFIFLCLFNSVSNAAAQIKMQGKESKKAEKKTKSFSIKGVAEYNELINNGFSAFSGRLCVHNKCNANNKISWIKSSG